MSEQSYVPTPGGPSGPRAGFFPRLAAYILDRIIIVGITVLLYVAISEALGVIFYLVALIGYFVYFEGRPGGQTPGKMALGIRVIDFSTGGSLGYGKAFIRWLGRILSEICLLGYLWAIWDKEKQTWHDKIANTVVVPTSAYPVG